MASIYKRGQIWWVKYSVDGRVVRKSLKTKAIATARGKLKKIQAKLDLGLLGATGEALVADVQKEFLEHQERIRMPSTVNAQRRQLTAFFEHAGVKRIGEVEARHVTAWLNSLDVSPSYRNQCRAAVHRLFVWAMREAGFVDRNPVARTARAREEQRPREYLTAEERDQVLERVAGEDLELPIAIMVFTGLRREECCRLTWPDIDLDGGHLTVAKAKSKRPRTVPLHRRLQELLEGHRRRRGPVCRTNGRAWTLDALSGAVRRLGREMDLEKLRGTHVLRHTFGSLLAQAGESPQNIKDWMGHSTLAVTQRYMHLAPGRRGKIDEL